MGKEKIKMEYNMFTGLFVIEVINSNPNGDPDLEGEPRRRTADNKGIITSVSIKRKYRDLIESKKNNIIWEGVSKELDLDEAKYKILESQYSKNTSIKKQLKENPNFIIDNYWDARLFGNTYLEKNGENEKNGPIMHIGTGALNIGDGISVHPIDIERMTFSRKANPEKDKKGGLAPNGYKVVPYGLYAVPFEYSPYQAARLKCTTKDIDLFFELTPLIYIHNKSLIRSRVNILHVHVGEHSNDERREKMTFRCHEFLESLTPTLIDGREGTSREDFIIPTWDDVKDYFPRVKTYRDLVEL